MVQLYYEIGYPEDHPVAAEGARDGQRGHEHGSHRAEDQQPRGDRLLCRHGVCKPRVTSPYGPKRREQRPTLQHPDPGEVMSEEGCYLGEGEDEDQVEEELQGVTRCSPPIRARGTPP